MKACGVELKVSLLPKFLPGEKVLHFKPWVWRGTAKSLPTYRVFFSLPPLAEFGFYVTDRRVLLVGILLRLLAVETSLWFPGRVGLGDHDLIKDVRSGLYRRSSAPTRKKKGAAECAVPAWRVVTPSPRRDVRGGHPTVREPGGSGRNI